MVTTRIEETLILGRSLVIPLIIMVIPTELENNIKEVISSQKIFNAMVEEKLHKVDDMARNMDRIAHDVKTLKIKIIPHKIDATKTLKSIQVTMNQSREKITRIRAKR